MTDGLRRRLRQAAIVVVLLVGTLAIVATSPPYTQVDIASNGASFRLDPEHPAALSRLVVRLSPETIAGAPHVSVNLSVNAIPPPPDGGAAATAEQVVRFIVASSQQGAAALPSPSLDSQAQPLPSPWQAEVRPGSAAMGLPIQCRPVGPCERGFWLIAVLTDPALGAVEANWHVTGSLGFGGAAYPSAANATFRVDAPILIAGPVPLLVASTPIESLSLGPDRPAAAREVEVTIGAAAIPQDGSPVGTLSVDLIRHGGSGGNSETPPLVRIYPLEGLDSPTSSGGALPSPAAPNADPFVGCRPAETCVRRFLVTIAWTGGGEGPIDWELTVRRADLVGVWSSPAELSARILRRFDVSTATPPSTVHLEGDAAAVAFDAPPQVHLALATRTTATDPLVGLLPVPGVMNYEARLLESDPTASSSGSPADSVVRTRLPSSGKGIFGYFRDGRVAIAANPFAGCQVGQDCRDLTIATIGIRKTTGAPLPTVRFHWSLDVTVYSFTDVPISVSADSLTSPTGSP